MSPNKILITGGNGNLGRLVAATFIAQGVQIISFDREGTVAPQGVTANIAGDIRDADLLAKTLDAHQPDAIIHLASLLSGSSEADPQAAWEINASASIALMRMAQERGIGPFVFASTIATYATDFPDTLPEDAPQWPGNVYGATKVAVERMGVWLKQSADFDFRCVRFPMVLSPFAPAGALTAYPSHAVKAAAQGQPFTFPVSPDTGMSTMFLDDVISSLVAFTVADRTALTRHAYNLHGFHFTAGELSQKIAARWPAATIDFAPNAQVDALIKGWPDRIDDTAATADWGWEPVFNFDRCFEALVALLEA